MLGVGEGRGGEGKAGLGWAAAAARGSLQLSLLNVPGGPRPITIDLLQFPSALVSQTSKGSPVWRVTAGCMQDILYETDYTCVSMTVRSDDDQESRALFGSADKCIAMMNDLGQ